MQMNRVFEGIPCLGRWRKDRRSRTGPMAALIGAALWLAAAAGAHAEIRANADYEPPDPAMKFTKLAPLMDDAVNLFLGTAAPAPEEDRRGRSAALAVDGQHDRPEDAWSGGQYGQLSLDLQEEKTINAIRLWTPWNGRRHYRYRIEGSPDGENWNTLVDRTQSTVPSTPEGEIHVFPPTNVRQVRVAFTDSAGTRLVEIEGYHLEGDLFDEVAGPMEAWAKVAPGLHGSVASLDRRYARGEVPEVEPTRAWSATAWRGERLSAQMVLWTADGAGQVRLKTTPLTGSDGNALDASSVRARFVRYVLADGQLLADILDTADRLDLPPRTARPVWVTIDVPPGADPGRYHAEVKVEAAGGAALSFQLEIEVLSNRVPPVSDWSFHLDLWQNPFAVARYHHVEPFSEEHFRILEPHLRLLAEAGQKCVTTTINFRPWGTQTYDPYDTMIEWVRRADGSWSFDYADFDQYVEFCRGLGITRAINCYSLVPWTNSVRYFDEATGDYVTVKAMAGSETHAEIWRPFLKDFAAHLRAKGWLGITSIAMDERPPEQMKSAIALVREAAPELKIALAGGNHPELSKDIDDYCVYITPPLDPAITLKRTRAGRPTTFYVCTVPARPNTFVASPPAESAWQGLYASAAGFTGFLRWAYDSWVEDPLRDASHVTWAAGDCFLVYPGARGSIRFERLREGIQDYEKIRVLRELIERSGSDEARAALRKLDEIFTRLTYRNSLKAPVAGIVNEAKAALLEASRAHAM